jgi:hypothetical protein
MKKRVLILAFAVLVAIAAAYFAQLKWWPAGHSPRDAVLARIPASATAVVFADLTELRNSPFAAQLHAWAPPPQQLDADYAQFLRDTGFDYERDLDRIAIAVTTSAKQSYFFSIADGRFDRKKLNVYASQYGTHEKISGREVFTIPVGAPASGANNEASASQKTTNPGTAPSPSRKFSFVFLTNNRMAVTTDPDPASLFAAPASGADAKEWRSRFDRVAGSPLFAVIRQDAAAGDAVNAHAPGGLRSPQLASLLDQLVWITIAGKPSGAILRLAAEGDCPAEECSHQLSDMLNGILLLAQSGLNDAGVRRRLAPDVRDAYVEFLKSAEVTRIDRGDSKSVRLMVEITPKFLDAAHTSPPPLQK